MTSALRALVERVRSAADAQHGRYLVGIAGPPGAGKSTLALALRAGLDAAAGHPVAEIAPMDGYHLTNAALRAAGDLARKGEPDTFDAAAYVDNLRRLRDTTLGESVPWPIFDRVVHDPTPAGIVFVDQRIAVTEGNYLLSDDFRSAPWSRVRGLLGEVWYLDAARAEIEQRLLRRHIEGGRTPEAAAAKVRDSDLRNAELIATTRRRADLMLRGLDGGYEIIDESR